MGTWNVRSMVDTEGLIEVASRWGQRGKDRKVDLIEMKLKRYDVKVAALQETKWFGRGVYQVGGSVVLTARRERPSKGDGIQRGEGVAIVLLGPAIVLLGPAIDAWKRLENSGRHGVQEQSQHAAGGRRDENKVACSVMLCSHKGK